MLLPILVASLVQLAAAEPLLAYSAPKAFLGLEQDTFKLNNGVIAFLPGFHACGTLQLISVDGLQHGDFAFLPSRNETAADLGDQTGSGLKEAYEGAETKDLEQNAREGEVVAWAKGWARSCGKGAAMKEVRAAKVEVDWGEDRKESVRKLDSAVAPYLSALPPPPHPHLVIISSFSSATFMTLLDVAGSTTHPSRPSTPSDRKDPLEHSTRRRRHHGFLFGVVKVAVWIGLLSGLAWVGQRYLETRKRRKELAGGIRLGDGDETDPEAEP